WGLTETGWSGRVRIDSTVAFSMPSSRLNGRPGGHAGPCVLVSSRDWDVSRPTPRGGTGDGGAVRGMEGPEENRGPCARGLLGAFLCPAHDAEAAARTGAGDGQHVGQDRQGDLGWGAGGEVQAGGGVRAGKVGTPRAQPAHD